MNVKQILLKHFAIYPKMQVIDAVKLLYQSEFGGGHMITNPEQSLNRLKQEWKQRQKSSEKTIVEEIGDGISRIDLAALDEGLAPETFNQMFINTAEHTVGTIENFEKKLAVLRELCTSGELPFHVEELDCYLNEYKAAGYPPVSHSEIYRECYHPSYRIISVMYARYLHVFQKIDRTLEEAGEKQVIIGIDGMCGSGKSTLGRILAEMYDCNVFYMDDFFLRPEQRTEERFAEPGGNVDYERFKEEIFDHLADVNGLSYQVYNCGIQALDGVVNVPYKKLNIIEGSYSHHPYFGNPYDLKFVCKISKEEQLDRILKRNGPEMLERFKSVWIPMENRYFDAFEIEENGIIV